MIGREGSTDVGWQVPAVGVLLFFAGIVIGVLGAIPEGIPKTPAATGTYHYSHLWKSGSAVFMVTEEGVEKKYAVFYKMLKGRFPVDPVDDHDGGTLEVVEIGGTLRYTQIP